MAEKKQNIIEPEVKWWNKPIDELDIGKWFQAIPIEEQIREAKEKDYGKVDKDWTFYESIIKGEPLKQDMYLNRMAGLMEQGGSRGGTKNEQFVMDQMGSKYKQEQEEKIKKEEEIKKKIADAKLKAEEEAALLDSPKGRLQAMWADADQRDAILGGIQDAWTEVKFGQDAYQSRTHDMQKNIRQNLKVAEATKLARQKAQLDMMKVAAETSKLANPAQYMTNSQKDAMAIVTASGIKPGTPEWNQEYARQLRQIVVKDLTSAKAGAIEPLFTFAQVLLARDDAQSKLTGQAMMDAITQITGYISGTDVGGGQSRNIIEVTEETETTT